MPSRVLEDISRLDDMSGRELFGIVLELVPALYLVSASDNLSVGVSLELDGNPLLLARFGLGGSGNALLSLSPVFCLFLFLRLLCVKDS